MTDDTMAVGAAPAEPVPSRPTAPWPGRRLALLFVVTVVLVVAHSQDILGRYIELQATWPDPEFGRWAHPEPLSFAWVAIRVFLVTLLAALPALTVLGAVGRRNGVPVSAVLTATFAGFIVIAFLGAGAPLLVRAIIGMQDPTGTPASPATFLVTPVVEELLKLLAILIVVAWTRLRIGTRGGLVLGAAVGIGVTVEESVGYSLVELVQRDDVNYLITIALRFALLGAGAHASTAALSGAGLGTWLSRRGNRRGGAVFLAGAVTLAMLTHGAWNRFSEMAALAVIDALRMDPGQPAVAFLVASLAAVPFLLIPWIVLAVAWRRGAAPPPDDATVNAGRGALPG